MSNLRESIPRPKTSKGHRDIDNIIHDLDVILTEPSPPKHDRTTFVNVQSSQQALEQEISSEEQEQLINEFLQNVSQPNLSESSDTIVPPLDLDVTQGQTTSRQEQASSKDLHVCKYCGTKTLSINFTPYSNRVCCLKCSHSQKMEGAENQTSSDVVASAATNRPRTESPIDPTSRSNYAMTTRRSSEQSERDEYADVEEPNQKAKKHKHKRCKLCNKNKNDVRFMPCKHKACSECANDLIECYVEKCKQEIKEKVVYHRSKSVNKNKKNEE